MKRTVPQSVFDSPEAIRIAKAGHREACRILDARHPSEIPESDPNHPRYGLQLFGVPSAEFLARQYR